MKKFFINITIKILISFKKINFGDFDKTIDTLIDKAIETLKNIISKWNTIKTYKSIKK